MELLMKLYKHHLSDRYGVYEDGYWINRITMPWSSSEKQEIWLIWLPSWGLLYSMNNDVERWGQRGVSVNLRTGQWREHARFPELAHV
jgi:hypothetical protein